MFTKFVFFLLKFIGYDDMFYVRITMNFHNIQLEVLNKNRTKFCVLLPEVFIHSNTNVGKKVFVVQTDILAN